MPTPQEYVLSFDFTTFTSQFSILNRSFTDFGESIHRLAGQVTTDLKGVQEQANQIFQTLSNLGMVSENGFASFERHLKQTSGYLDDYSKKSAEISQKLKDISSADLSNVSKVLSGASAAESKTADITPGGGKAEVAKEMEAMKDKLDEIMSKLGETGKTLADQEKKMDDFFTVVWKAVETEAKNAKAKAGGIFTQLTGGLLSGGGLIAMSLGFILMGKKEEYRKGQEKGEMVNVFEAGTAGIGGKAQEKAIDWMSKFQERAQKLYGIGKDEVQSVTKQMIDSGYKVTTHLGQFTKQLGEVGTNVMTTTIGLDKMYNMATGTSAANVNKLVSDYGDSLSGAAQKYTELAFAAQRSGMGVSKFVDSVMSGSQALAQYGIEMNDIKDVMQQLQKYYKDMGLTDQAAGARASLAVQGMATMAGGDPQKLALAAELFPTMGRLEALQKLEEGARRVASGEDVGFFKDMTKAKIAIASRATRGQKTPGIEYLVGAGYFPDRPSAAAAWDLVSTGKIDSVYAADQEDVKKQMSALRDAYKTESMTLSELQKNQYNLLQGLGTLGQGLLKILSAFLGTVVTGFYWLTSLPERLAMSDTDKKTADEAIKKSFAAQGEALAAGLDQMKGGGGAAGEALRKMGLDMFSSLKPALDLMSDPKGTVDLSTKRFIVDAGKKIDFLSGTVAAMWAKMFGTKEEEKYILQELAKNQEMFGKVLSNPKAIDIYAAGMAPHMPGWGPSGKNKARAKKKPGTGGQPAVKVTAHLDPDHVTAGQQNKEGKRHKTKGHN